MSTRSRTGITTLDCGCKHSDREWVFECATHKRKESARHRRAHAEHMHTTGRLSAADLEVVRAETQAEEDAETEALGGEFFEKAALTKAGESVIDTVKREFPKSS